MKNSSFYKVLGVISVISCIIVVLIAIIANITGDAMPYYLKWRLLIVVPFVFVYGVRQLRKAKYYQILEESNIEEVN